jgi:hypothetical protein
LSSGAPIDHGPNLVNSNTIFFRLSQTTVAETACGGFGVKLLQLKGYIEIGFINGIHRVCKEILFTETVPDFHMLFFIMPKYSVRKQ